MNENDNPDATNKSRMNGEMTLPCSTDAIMKILSDRFEVVWKLTFGHTEEIENEN